ncbi:MAG: TRAP transporter small permease [Candidatus Omnitrophica bacterium]|nr:TRAP transporter small permease [Candidatus Omnitrophota bacterium]
MKKFLQVTGWLAQGFNWLAGVSLTFLLGLTVLDVVLRGFKQPIVGTYELVGFAGAIVIGFSLPYTSWCRGHVYVDFLLSKLNRRVRQVVNCLTRLASLAIFFLSGWRLMAYGSDLKRLGEVSLTLQLPFYPVAWGLGLSCWLVCLIFVADLVKIFRGGYE